VLILGKRTSHGMNGSAELTVMFGYVSVVQYLMEFNGSPGDLMELSSLFSDDARVAEAAAVAQKLRKLRVSLLPLYYATL
jgi:hypothetical protein